MPRAASLTVALLLTALVVAPAATAAPGDSAATSAAAWRLTETTPAPAQRGAQPAVQPDRFQALQLDRAALEGVLAGTPDERAAGSTTLSLPTPTGGFERFAVQRSSVMEPGLAAQHPEISTFSGTGIDVPGSTVRLDLGSLGLHASVLGPEGAWYIDPYYHREQSAYVSYFGRDLTKNPHGSFLEGDFGTGADPLAEIAPQPQAAPSDVQLRTYRLALASDPSYADYFGAANVTSAKVALINRVNQVYINDLAIEMTLIDENDQLNLNTDAEMTGTERAVRDRRLLHAKPDQVLLGGVAGSHQHRDRSDRRRRQLRHRPPRARSQRWRDRRARGRRRPVQGARVHRRPDAGG